MDLFALNPTLTSHLFTNTTTLSRLIIRPVQADDIDLILEMHQRLSSDSLYKRYHTPRLPTRREIEQICALNSGNGRVIIAAVAGKKPFIVGMAYYVRSGQDTAETAFLVEDSYQGLGIGRRLIQQLSRLALRQGIRFFDAYVLPSNQPMIHLLHQTGPLVHNKLDLGARDIRIQLGPV